MSGLGDPSSRYDDMLRWLAVQEQATDLPLIVQRINRRRDPVAAVKGSGEDGGLFDLLDDEGAAS